MRLIDRAIAGGAAILTINRPDKLNALTPDMLSELGDRLEAASREAAGVVVTGAGRAFSAGDDLPATENLDAGGFEDLLARFQELTRIVLRSEVPIVAALNGIAVGGAAEFTLCCDARVGWSGSDYLFPENTVGLTISNASSYLLPRLLGGRALPLVLEGRRISGEEARDLGIIDTMVDGPDDVLPRAVELLEAWHRNGLATPYHLRLLRPPLDEVERAIERENDMAREAWQAGTAQEGIRRFSDRRR